MKKGFFHFPPLFVLATTALSLTGCGKIFDNFSRQKPGFTRVSVGKSRAPRLFPNLKFENAITPNSVLNGGLIVYAQKAGTPAEPPENFSISGSTEDENLSLLLPNGHYDFRAFAWTAADLTGPVSPSPHLVRCDSNDAFDLNGTPITVDLNLNNTAEAECVNSGIFVPGFATQTSPHTTIQNVNFNFCNKFADLSTKDASGSLNATHCGLGEESSDFFLGEFSGAVAQAKMDRGKFFSSSNTLMFTATKNGTQTFPSPPAKPFDLYRYDISSGVQKKISPPNPDTSVFGVTSLKKVPNAEQLIFRLETSTKTVLYLYKLGSDTLVDLSKNSTGHVKDFQISPSGSHVIMVGDLTTSGVVELYTVPLTGATYPNPVKISGALSGGSGIPACSVGCDDDHKYLFEISPSTSSPYVVYAAEVVPSSKKELFISSLSGADLPAGTVNGTGMASVPKGTKISGSELALSGDLVDFFQINFEGKYLLYHAHLTSPVRERIYQIDLDVNTTAATPSTTITLNTTPLLASDARSPYVLMGNSTRKAMLFSFSPTGIVGPRVSIADLSTSTVKILQDFGGGSSAFISQAKFTSNDAIAAFAFTDSSNVVSNLYSSITTIGSDYNGTSPGPAISHTGDLSGAGRQVFKGGTGGGKYFTFDSSQDKLLFLSDLSTANFRDLYFGTLADSSTPNTKILGAFSATHPITSFGQASSGKIYVAAARDTSLKELYSVPLAANATPTRIGSASKIFEVQEVNADTDGETISGTVAIEAHTFDANSPLEAWIYQEAASGTGTFKRMTTLGGDPTATGFGAGRFMVKILMEPLGEDSHIEAFQSACLSHSSGATDGDMISTNVRIPLGTGAGHEPFATEIDVFPLASDCSGTSRTYFYPNGLSHTDANSLLDGVQNSGVLFFQKD